MLIKVPHYFRGSKEADLLSIKGITFVQYRNLSQPFSGEVFFARHAVVFVLEGGNLPGPPAGYAGLCRVCPFNAAIFGGAGPEPGKVFALEVSGNVTPPAGA